MLVAIEREVGLGEYVEQGVPINGDVTHELLETIFYPGSALHDGAVVIQTDQIAAAGCLFPLTDDPAISKSTGTRHRAAIGISEQTDAVTVIVSEETGRISITVGGKIRTDLTPEQLEQALRELMMRAERPDEPPYKMKPPTEGDGPLDGNGDPTPPTLDLERPSDKGKSSTKRDKKKS